MSVSATSIFCSNSSGAIWFLPHPVSHILTLPFCLSALNIPFSSGDTWRPPNFKLSVWRGNFGSFHSSFYHRILSYFKPYYIKHTADGIWRLDSASCWGRDLGKHQCWLLYVIETSTKKVSSALHLRLFVCFRIAHTDLHVRIRTTKRLWRNNRHATNFSCTLQHGRMSYPWPVKVLCMSKENAESWDDVCRATKLNYQAMVQSHPKHLCSILYPQHVGTITSYRTASSESSWPSHSCTPSCKHISWRQASWVHPQPSRLFPWYWTDSSVNPDSHASDRYAAERSPRRKRDSIPCHRIEWRGISSEPSKRLLGHRCVRLAETSSKLVMYQRNARATCSMAMSMKLVNCPVLDSFETLCTGHLLQAAAHPIIHHAVDLWRETDNIPNVVHCHILGTVEMCHITVLYIYNMYLNKFLNILRGSLEKTFK